MPAFEGLTQWTCELCQYATQEGLTRRNGDHETTVCRYCYDELVRYAPGCMSAMVREDIIVNSLLRRLRVDTSGMRIA